MADYHLFTKLTISGTMKHIPGPKEGMTYCGYNIDETLSGYIKTVAVLRKLKPCSKCRRNHRLHPGV